MKRFFFFTLLLIASTSIFAQSPTGKHLIKYLEINTTESDYGVALLEEDKLVFKAPSTDKTSTRTNIESPSDLFVGTINSEGEIVDKKPLTGFQKKKLVKTGIVYTNDMKTVYFSVKKYRRKARKNEKQQLLKADIDADGNWTNITTLPFSKSKYFVGQPSLSKDGKKLYFVSNMPTSYGGLDIFSVTINDDGTYGEPTNLGSKINTTGNEVTPYITEQNILYFSSNGHKEGMGNLDVYATEIFENTASEPLHLDAPINSINDDFAYIINDSNKKGYFASNRLQGQSNQDIYSFIIEEVKPEKCVQEIAGIVRDKETQEILTDAVITLFDNEENQVQQTVTNAKGEYGFTLDCNDTYTLVASSLYHNKEEHVINTANYINAPSLEANKFLVKKTEETDQVATTVTKEKEDTDTVTTTETKTTPSVDEAVVNSIYFDFDSSDIRTDATEELDNIVMIMKANKDIKVEVSSFTDSRGSSAYNVKLSNRRAQSTIDYLVSQGVDRSRLTGKGYGESRMVNKCVNGVECSEVSHQKNRRTEFVILNN